MKITVNAVRYEIDGVAHYAAPVNSAVLHAMLHKTDEEAGTRYNTPNVTRVRVVVNDDHPSNAEWEVISINGEDTQAGMLTFTGDETLIAECKASKLLDNKDDILAVFYKADR